MKWTTPEAASPLPLKGAEARGSKPTGVGLDRPRDGRVWRPCGLQGPLADRQSRIRGGRAIGAVVCLTVCAALAAAPSLWQRLEADGIHDPKNPAITLLQQPAEALAPLPRDGAGNLVNWVQAIESGAINPRTNILPGTEVRVRDDAIIVAKYGSMPAVRFPHRAHTLWLDCANCHDKLFKAKAGANRFSMTAILNGEQCGVCHGAVSFPLTECNRCHSVPNASLPRETAREPPRQGAAR